MTTLSSDEAGFGSFDPFDATYLADPYPTLRRIQEATPALFIERHRIFLITRYDDVVTTTKRHEIFSSTGGVGIEWQSRPMMPMYDPPKHTQLRRMVAPFFTPKAVQTYSAAIAATAEDTINRALERGPTDFVHEIAEVISISTLATLLGVPPERQRDLRRWADTTMAALASGVTDDAAVHLEASRKEFVAYLRATIEERRREPREDLISVLLKASNEERLTEKELIAFCVLLLVAGFEPSASAMVNVVRALATNWPTLDVLPDSDAGRAIAADELLRFDSPVQAFFRNTLTEANVGGVQIPKDTKVMVHFAAANRDPRIFRDPDTLDLKRSPNPHIAFGVGVHTCLGGAIARLQLGALLRVLRQKVAKVEPVESEVRLDNLLFRGLARYVVKLTPR